MADREAVSVGGLRRRAEILASARRAGQVLAAGCPICGAETGDSCPRSETRPVIRLGPDMYADYLRVQKSVGLGFIAREDVLEQFPDGPPAGLRI